MTTTPRHDRHPYLDDPVAFARQVHAHLAVNDPRAAGSPGQYAALEQTFLELRAALLNPEPEVERLLTAAENQALELAGAQHDAGLVFGVGAEGLRRSILEGSSPS